MLEKIKETTTQYATGVNQAALEFTKSLLEAQSAVAKTFTSEFTKHYDQEKVNSFFKPWQELAVQSARVFVAK